MPEQDSEHLTPATKLLEKRREMAEVEQALATQKEASELSFLSLMASWCIHIDTVCDVCRSFR